MRADFLVILFFLPLPAFAHVTLVAGNAAPGATYEAQFKVGHGCSGSPTTGLRIEIPPSVTGVEALAVAGWTIASEKDASGRITAVRYAGGTLAADKPGLFSVRLHLPKAPGPLSFAVHQACATGAEDWTGPAGAAHPAPVLMVGAPAQAEPAMSGMDMKSMPAWRIRIWGRSGYPGGRESRHGRNPTPPAGPSGQAPPGR
jgi:hypothetical protein